MTDQEFVRRTLEKMREYKERYTPEERWAHLVASGLINEKGEVLMTPEERKAGHLIDDPPRNGSSHEHMQ